MLDQVTNLESDSDIALPTASLDLSTRMRDLRARQGLKQSEVARRMRLDPSIPSLWEQGKRLVPANRVRALADALEVTVEELLDGVAGAQPRSSKAPSDPSLSSNISELIDDRAVRPLPADDAPLLRLMPEQIADEPALVTPDGETITEQWVIPERPPLEGWIPEGWQPTDRVQDITPALPDGYWLDPVKLEKTTARQLLRSRLCAEDRHAVGERVVPGAALAERLYRHCSKEDGFLPTGRLPLAESIFRCVLTADHGGLTDGALVEMLRERSGAVPVSTTLLRRLRDSVRPYPIRRVDAELFGARTFKSR
ncbi:MAG: helix-turn-helix transcriptional regulator [Chloroflexi bacterium]|nr:helix-turn-helix transcriptional regulator [Chloroflexota bacterium]